MRRTLRLPDSPTPVRRRPSAPCFVAEDMEAKGSGWFGPVALSVSERTAVSGLSACVRCSAAQLLLDPALGLRPTSRSALDTQEPPQKAAGSHSCLLPIARPRGASFPRVYKLLVHVGLEPRATGLLTPRGGLTRFSVNPNHLG